MGFLGYLLELRWTRTGSLSTQTSGDNLSCGDGGLECPKFPCASLIDAATLMYLSPNITYKQNARQDTQASQTLVRWASEARAERSRQPRRSAGQPCDMYPGRSSTFVHHHLTLLSPHLSALTAPHYTPLSPTPLPPFDLWKAMINSSHDGATLVYPSHSLL
jgi:hypothetical protein